jgi:hypothetical protein
MRPTYVDGTEAGTVTSSHVLVEGLNSLGPAHLTELLVHVVGTGARVVAEPDTEVLDLERALLVDLTNKKRDKVSRPHLDRRILSHSRHTTLRLTISPLAFLTLRSWVKKYQKRDLATTVLGAKMRMRYSLGVGLASVGR